VKCTVHTATVNRNRQRLRAPDDDARWIRRGRGEHDLCAASSASVHLGLRVPGLAECVVLRAASGRDIWAGQVTSGEGAEQLELRTDGPILASQTHTPKPDAVTLESSREPS